ncbi:MAG: HlyD family secretion protein [Bacteroidales bacterium]|jgi:HlyD family secretion protein|nr:HlyD family secretion protein [Bacteroidales bacterium]
METEKDLQKKASKYSTPDKIELRSEEVQEILGRPPRWMIRYGITIIFIVISGIFVGSYFFKYPDIVKATITINTENLPADMIAKSSGRIDSIFVSEKQSISKGDIIAMIENTANLSDVQKLKESIVNFSINDSLFNDTLFTEQLNLGTLQQGYYAFVKAYNDYQTFVKTDYYHRKADIAKRQLAAQKTLVQKLQTQLALDGQSFTITQQTFAADSVLFAKKAISLSDYQTSKQTYIQAQQTFANAKINIDNQKVSILQLEQNIIELQKQYTDNLNQLTIALNGAWEALTNDIKTWEQTYLFISPVSGIVTMTRYWQKNQNINAGEAFASVVPKEDTKIIGKILLPPQGAGKVKEGQMVNVKFDNFPSMEYGMVKVRIKSISLVPVQEKDGQYYMLEVEFPSRLITNYGKELKFSQQMSGTAEIITEDLRLLDKFINPIKAIINK